MERNKKPNKNYLVLIALILFITIGYALLSQDLHINGTSMLANSKWDIHWDNVKVTEGSITGDQVLKEAVITNEEQTLVEYSINLKKPKEFYEFTVDAVNEGTIDGMIDVVTNKAYEADGVTEREIPSYITYTVTYGDDYEIDEKHLLKAGEAETYKVRIEFKDISDATELPQSEDTIIFKFNVDYTQADESGEERDRYSPFTTNFSTEGLSLISFDIDYDKCMEMYDGQVPEEIDAAALCRGEDITYQGQTINLNELLSYDPQYAEESGLIKNVKYGKPISYEINYDGCKNYLLNEGENEEQVELFCTGNTATIFGEEQSIEQMIQDTPEVSSTLESLGIINAIYTEEKPPKIITGYEEEVPKNLVIPNEIDGRKVIGIAESAFEGKGIKSVTLPDTIEFVEQDAFFDNDLIAVNIGNNNPEIRDCAFGDKDNIENHNLPETYKCKKIFWALQDNDNDQTRETLVVSSKKVSGYYSGRFDEDESFASFGDVPWIATTDYSSVNSNKSARVTTVNIEKEIKPISTANWFAGVGYNASSFNMNAERLDTSQIIDMSHMFYYVGYKATTWNIGDLSDWNISNVMDMSYMFANAGHNTDTWNIGNLNVWDTSKVTNMSNMFNEAGYSATTWNIGNLNNWNTSQVTNMFSMFSRTGTNATSWNIGNLSNWDTSKVTNMGYMFDSAGENATTFNLNLSNWNISNVTNMSAMFDLAGKYATTWDIGDLSSWDTSKVTDMRFMFSFAGQNATTFSLNLNGWNTSNITDMSNMFQYVGENSTTFNLYLGGWDTSKVTNMPGMFQHAGYNAATFSLKIPQTNGNGINNDTTHMYGSTTSTYASPPNNRSFTLAAT